MGDDQDRLAQPVQVMQVRHQRMGARLILANGGLIQNEQSLIEHQHGGDRQQPALPDAEAERTPGPVRVELKQFEHLADPAPYLGLVHPAHAQGVSHFVEDGVGDELMIRVLEHVADRLGQLEESQVVDVAAVDQDRPAPGLENLGQDLGERALARPVASDEGGELAGRDSEPHVGECLHTVALVRVRQPAHVDERLAGRGRRRGWRSGRKDGPAARQLGPQHAFELRFRQHRLREADLVSECPGQLDGLRRPQAEPGLAREVPVEDGARMVEGYQAPTLEHRHPVDQGRQLVDVVLDNHDSIALLNQRLQHHDQALYVGGVQPDGRLIKNVQRSACAALR